MKNAQVLSQTILEGGLDLVSGGTDNHLMLVDLRPAHLTGKEMEHRLDEVYITVNKNAIPNDPEKPFVTSGIRVGTPAVTARGFREAGDPEVGTLICQCARDDSTPNTRVPARPGEGPDQQVSSVYQWLKYSQRKTTRGAALPRPLPFSPLHCIIAVGLFVPPL